MPPTAQENDDKHQQMTIAKLHEKIQNLTQYTLALQHRIDKEHIYHKDQEYKVTILCRYVVNQDKYIGWLKFVIASLCRLDCNKSAL